MDGKQRDGSHSRDGLREQRHTTHHTPKTLQLLLLAPIRVGSSVVLCRVMSSALSHMQSFGYSTQLYLTVFMSELLP